MNDIDAPLRRVRQLRGYGAIAVALVLAASWIWAPLPLPTSVAVLVVAAIGVFAGVQLWLARRTPEGARMIPAGADFHLLPRAEKIGYARRQLLLVGALFPAVSLWIAYDLYRLETGAVRHVRLWAPIVFIYEQFGYWPAVFTFPLIGTLVVAIWIRKLTTVEDAFSNSTPTAP